MIWLPCEKNCENSNQFACRSEERAMEFIREEGEFGEAIVIAECGNCHHINAFLKEEWEDGGRRMDLRAQRTGKACLTRYPRVEPFTGEVVKSREHEKETLKRMGFHAAEHGVNDNFNDETTEKLKDRNRAIKERREKIKKKREAYIREGLIKRPKPIQKKA